MRLALAALLTAPTGPFLTQPAGDRLEAPLPTRWLRQTDDAKTIYGLAGDDETRIELYPTERVDQRTAREWFERTSAAARGGAMLVSQGEISEERRGDRSVLLRGQLTRGGPTGTWYRYVAGLEQDGLRALLVLEALDERCFRRAVAEFTVLHREARLIRAKVHDTVAPATGAGSDAARAASVTARLGGTDVLTGGWYGSELRSQLNWATGSYSHHLIT